MVKSYKLPGDDNRPFLAYMVPKAAEPDDQSADTDER